MTWVLAILKAIPILNSWFKQLATLYVTMEINNLHEADRAAIKKAIYEQDQRDLEKQIGNPDAGKPSNLDGAIVVDSLPNVVPDTEKK